MNGKPPDARGPDRFFAGLLGCHGRRLWLWLRSIPGLISLLACVGCSEPSSEATLVLLHASNAQAQAPGLVQAPSQESAPVSPQAFVLPEFACQAGTPLEMRLTLADPLTSGMSLRWSLQADGQAPIPLPQCPTRLEPDQPLQLFCTVDDLKALLPDCAQYDGAGQGVGAFQVTVALEPDGSFRRTQTVQAPGRFPSVKGLTESTCTPQREALSKLRKDPAQLEAYLTRQPVVRDCFLQAGFPEIAYRIQERRVDQLQRVGAPPVERLEAAAGLIPLAPAGNPVREIEARWLSARMALYAGEYHRAWKWLKEARERAEMLGWEEPRGEVARVLAQWGMNVGDWELALTWGRTCMQLGQATHRDDLVADCGLEVLAPTLAQTGLEGPALQVAADAFEAGLRQYGIAQRSEAWTSVSNLGWLLLDLQAPPVASLRRVSQAVRSVLAPVLTEEQGRLLAGIPSRLEAGATLETARGLAELLFGLSLQHWQAEGHGSRIANAYRNLAWVALRRGALVEAQRLLTLQGEAPALEDSPRFAADYSHLSMRLALAQKDEAKARAAWRQLREISEWAEGEVPLWQRQSLEGQLLALAGDDAGAIRVWQESLHTLQLASAQAAFAGRAAGFLARQREVRDLLLARQLAQPEEWLKTFHTGLTRPVPLSETSAGEIRRASPAWETFVATLEKSAHHQQLRQRLPVNEKPQWEAQARSLQLEREQALAALGVQVAVPSVPELPGLLHLLPDDAEVWVLSSLPQAVVGFRLRSDGSRPFQVTLSREALLQASARLEHHLLTEQPLPTDDLTTLARLLPPLQPLQRLVLILDPMLEGLPLGLLPLGGQAGGTLLGRVRSLSQALDLGSLATDLSSPAPSWWGCPAVVADSDPLRPLPSARQSVQTLTGLASCTQARVGAEATRETVLPLLMQNTPVHLAVHGQAQALDLAGAWLVLAGGQLLTAAELQRHRLFPGLMFLASCEGGAGGAAGSVLARAALVSGARAVIASRFVLPDAGAQTVTQAFYQRLAEGDEPSSALTRALQKAVADDSAAAFLRGGLFLVGDPGWRRSGGGQSGPAAQTGAPKAGAAAQRSE